ncbi:MAG TPA: alpha/beta fold hydrolase [Burkholderiales bacterium]
MTPLLFLHGLGGGHHAWERQLPYFGGLGYPAHAWDQPGYGHSAIVEPYDLEQVCASLARLIGSLGDEPVVLIGHSMGGLIAQETYVRYPKLIKALALCFTSPAFAGGSSEFTRKFIAARVDPLDRGKTMAEIAKALMPTMRGTVSDPSGLELAEKIMAGVPPDTYRKAVHLLTTFDRRKELADIKVPALLVAGSEDKTAPPAVMEKMAQKIPGSEYVLLQGCGHLGPMDQPDAFNDALLFFLQNHGL